MQMFRLKFEYFSPNCESRKATHNFKGENLEKMNWREKDSLSYQINF